MAYHVRSSNLTNAEVVATGIGTIDRKGEDDSKTKLLPLAEPTPEEKTKSKVGKKAFTVALLPFVFLGYFVAALIPWADADGGLRGPYSIQLFNVFTWLVTCVVPLFVSAGNLNITWPVMAFSSLYLLIFDYKVGWDLSDNDTSLILAGRIAFVVAAFGVHWWCVSGESRWLRNESRGLHAYLPTVKELVTLSFLAHSLAGAFNYNKADISFMMTMCLALMVMGSQGYLYDWHSKIQLQTDDLSSKFKMSNPLGPSAVQPYKSLRSDCEDAFAVAAPACGCE